jgi:hypothetical protein
MAIMFRPKIVQDSGHIEDQDVVSNKGIPRNWAIRLQSKPRHVNGASIFLVTSNRLLSKVIHASRNSLRGSMVENVLVELGNPAPLQSCRVVQNPNEQDNAGTQRGAQASECAHLWQADCN